MDAIKDNAKKAIGIAIGTGLVAGITLLAAYLINYAISASQNSSLTGSQ